MKDADVRREACGELKSSLKVEHSIARKLLEYNNMNTWINGEDK